MKIKMNQKGFTLIELLIVIAIIAILAAIAIPQFSAYRLRAYNGSALSDLRNTAVVQGALSQDYQSYGVTQTGAVLPGLGTTAQAAGNVVLGPQGGASTTVAGAMLTANELSETNLPKGLPIGVGSGVGILASVSLTPAVTIGTNAAVVTANSYTMLTKHTMGHTAYGSDSDTTAMFYCLNDSNVFIGIAITAGGAPTVLPPPTSGSNDFGTNTIACNGDAVNPNWVAK